MSEGLENVAMLETSCLRAEGIDQAKNKVSIKIFFCETTLMRYIVWCFFYDVILKTFFCVGRGAIFC